MNQIMKNITQIISSVYVKDIMSKDVFTMEQEKTVFAAIRDMSSRSFSSTVVVDDGKPVGIVTEKDLMRKVLVEGRDPKKIKLREVMSTDLIFISPSAPIKSASYVMKKQKVRHLLVGDSANLEGILTQTDIIRSFNKIYDNYRYLLWNPKLYIVLFMVLTLLYIIGFFIRR
jgi:CBS domain-containing protein